MSRREPTSTAVLKRRCVSRFLYGDAESGIMSVIRMPEWMPLRDMGWWWMRYAAWPAPMAWPDIAESCGISAGTVRRRPIFMPPMCDALLDQSLSSWGPYAIPPAPVESIAPLERRTVVDLCCAMTLHVRNSRRARAIEAMDRWARGVNEALAP